MRVYGLAYRDTMNLPLPVFWHLSGTVPRLISGERKDTLELLVTAAHNPEGAGEMMKHFEEMAPEPVKISESAIAIAKISEELDTDGLNELRGMV